MLTFTSISLLVLAFVKGSSASDAKRGLAFADTSDPSDISLAENTQVSWVYDWGVTAPSYLADSGITYIPMQWGASGVETFASAVTAQGAKTILGFNEPDMASQSNIEPATAASLWMEYIQPLKAQGVTLGGPAVTNGPTGTPWLAQFLGNCTSCEIDFMPLHWYGEGVGNFYNYIWSFHGEFSAYPLWVTEFASTSPDTPDVESFLNASIAYLDSLDWIEGYAWFAFYRNDSTSYYSLLDANGEPNVLGEIYLDQVE